MKFDNIKDKKPDDKQECLIKYSFHGDIYYGIATYSSYSNRFYCTGGSGWFGQDEILGWMPTKDLDEIPVMSQQEEEQRRLAEKREAFKLAFANYCQRRAFFDLD